MKPGHRQSEPAPRKEKTSRPRSIQGKPNSVWQRLVDGRIQELGISWRALVPMLATNERTLTHTAIRAWTRNAEGTPPRATYTEEINRKLATALELKPEVLAQAFEESRRHLIIAGKTAAHMGPLSVLRRLFAESKQTTWEAAEICKLIDDVQGI